MIKISDHNDGCIVNVRAQPGARRNLIVGEQDGALKVAVTAPPDKGRANDSIVLVLADALGLKRAQVELVAGATSKHKKFLLHNVTSAQLRTMLQPFLEI